MSQAKKSEVKTNVIQMWGDIPDWAYAAVAGVLQSLRKVDPATYEHCLRVGEYSRILTKYAGLNEYQQKVAEFSGILHDIGKMAVGFRIVHKPGKLDDAEMAIMKSHSVHSEEIIRPFEIHDFFKSVSPAVRGHHERVDGKGYPDKLSGEEIPVISRVILLVDTLDAMGQNRAYRAGLPIEEIYKEIQKYSGTQFDSALAKIFLESHKFWSQEKQEEITIQKIHKKSA